MTFSRTVFLAGFAALFLLAAPSFADDAKKAADKPAASAAGEVVERGWKERCPETKDEKKEDKKSKKQCEIFQRVDLKNSEARVAELAIGFPDDKKLEKGGALGAVVLPLGILVDLPVGMKIDDGKPLSFRIRYCTNAGCVSYIALPKASVEAMKSGKLITFAFKTAEGRDVTLLMSLDGFAGALKSVQ